MHKFLLAENPQAPDTGGLWVLKLTSPIAIIELGLRGEKIHCKAPLSELEYTYCNTDGVIEKWQLRLRFIEPCTISTRRAIMDDAWHWYKSYLTWEDKNIDTDEEATRN